MKIMNERTPLKTAAVKAFCQGLWDARVRGGLRPAEELSRELATATAEDVAACKGYDPEADQRVLWARVLIRELRVNPRRRPAADGDREAIAQWLLDRMPTPTGRALALADA
jgi:hypothetical protein